MAFFEVVDQVLAVLERRHRVSYRALQREFALDEAALDALKVELITAQQVARDEDGTVLVWIGKPRPGAFTTPAREAERRQLTVMFCDLVGSTALSEQLDPEELRELVRAYQELCAGIIGRFEGHIAQYLGDGLLVYFGYPVAYEDEPHRAVWTGLRIIEALPSLSLPGIQLPFPLQVRIGIHTGQVVVGEIGVQGRSEQLAIGEAPNIAARLQGLAEPNSVLISATTHRLVQRIFDCHTNGAQALKGISAAVEVYRVQGERRSPSRFPLPGGTGLVSLVGREPEVSFLTERWQQARHGAGQVVLLSGEAGIGKSRLVQELSEQVGPDGPIRVTLRCLPYYHNSPLSPLIEHLQRVMHFEPNDSPQTKLAKLEHTLSSYAFPEAETVGLLASLLSLPLPKTYPALQLSPQRQRQKIHQTLVNWLLEEAQRKPLYCIWEDLHWADPSTLEFLSQIIEHLPTARMFVLLVFRPEFLPPWASQPFIHPLPLGRLEPDRVEELVVQITRGKPLPASITHQITSRTDGVPLFVEEVTKMVLESGFVREVNTSYELTGPVPLLSIPATLQDSLEARLDHLSSGKELAQLGATLGREFSYALIRAVSPLDEHTLQHELNRLVEEEVLTQRGQLPHASYFFRQTLLQEIAYQSLLKSKRQAYHHQIARTLEDRFPEISATKPELVAHHYTQAGVARKAIPYWQQAGQHASESSANAEAIRHLNTGLALLETLPESPERLQQELRLRITLGAPLTATQGYTAREVEALYSRALELCRHLGETPQLFLVLFGLWRFYFVSGKSNIARELAEQSLRQAESINTPDFLMTAHLTLGLTLCGFGELAAAQDHLEQSLALYDPSYHRPDQPRGALFGQDPKVVGLSYLAMILWLRGYPEQARVRSREALDTARTLQHPFSLVLAVSFAATVHRMLRDQVTVKAYADEEMAIAQEQGFAFWLPSGQLARGWALAEQGQVEEGLSDIQQAISAWEAIGAGKEESFVYCMQTEAYRRGGKIEAGLATVDKGITFIREGAESSQQADLYRLRGELLLELEQENQESKGKSPRAKLSNSYPPIPTPQSEAETCFQRAIAIAQRNDAKSLELRAVTSLSRLWKRQGKADAARQRLAEIYNWFTEGFETVDLQAARALLEELAP